MRRPQPFSKLSMRRIRSYASFSAAIIYLGCAHRMLNGSRPGKRGSPSQIQPKANQSNVEPTFRGSVLIQRQRVATL